MPDVVMRAIYTGYKMQALAVAATLVSAAGTIMSGNAARGAANYQAVQYEQQAGQERAASQRQAIEARRQAGLANSTVQARAAASGAGATDPTVLDIESDNAGTGEYNALAALYSGEEKARGLEMQAGATRYQGQQARKASLFKAGGTLLSGSYNASQIGSGQSLFDKYGAGGPNELPTLPSQLPWQNTPGYVVPNYA